MTVSHEQDACIDDEQAIALLEKRVDHATRQRIDAHLDGCDACRELVSALAIAGAPEGGSEPEIDLGRLSSIDLAEDGSLTMLRDTSARPPARDSERTQVFGKDAKGAAPLEKGDLVAHFRIMRQLGRGAMGEVYVARDTLLGRKVALKVIAPDLLNSEKAVRRFLFEARATARFNHPNIVTIHAVGEHDGRPYVALEYVEGENLRERCQRQRPSLSETLRIGQAVANALAEAHAAGILHRDLKPANVVMGRDGRVRVVDFGLAKAVQALDDDADTGAHGVSSSAWLVGTPRYMAPEQWEGDSVTAAADVWALGTIIFELCSGRRPIHASTTVELLRAVCSSDPVQKLSSVCDVPGKLSQLVADCLEKKPEARPSAEEVARRFSDIIAAEQQTRAAVEAPFRSLLPFDERHASMFFGRDAEIEAFLERMRLEPVLPVLGPSGAGKTSFIQAGVIPRLREQDRWVVLLMRPGMRPFDTLAARLERGDVSTQFGSGDRVSLPNLSARSARITSSPRQLSIELREMAEQEEARVLLVVDQLEELFTLVDNPEVQRAFLESVLKAADDPDDPVRVIVSLRHDFVDRLAVVGALPHFTVLKPPDGDALADILLEPVERCGYSYEDDALCGQMVAAVQGEPSALALLQFAASQLWEARDQRRKLLLRAAYEEMGGVGGALAKHADSVLDGLPPADRDIARSLLLRLVTPERSRRVVPRQQALDGLGPSGARVLEKLADARLVSITAQRRGDDPSLELTHDALIHTWHTLASWIAHSADELRLLAEASQAAALWERRGRRIEELWRGDGLRDAERLLSQASTDVPAQIAHFLRASREAEAESARKRRAGRRALVAALGAVSLVAVAAVVVFALRQQDAQSARDRADSLRAQAEHDEARALLDGAGRALDRNDPLAARAMTRRAFEIEDGATARAMWQRLETQPLLARLGGSASHALAFAADGTLVVGSQERVVRLIDPRAGVLASWHGHDDAVSAIAVGEAHWVSGDRSGKLRAWSRDGSARDLERVEGTVSSLALAGDGRTLAAAGAGLQLLDLRSGKIQMRLEGHTALVVGVAFAGDALISGSLDGTVRVWDRKSGLERRVIEAPDQVRAIAVADRRIAAATHGGAIVVWDLDGREQRRIEGGRSPRAIALSHDGRRLASGGDDGVVQIHTGDARVALRLSGSVAALAFSRDGTQLAAAGDTELRVWDVAAAQAADVSTPRAHAGAVRYVALAGGTVASAGADHRIFLWQLDSAARRLLEGHADQVTGVALSADETLLASSSRDGSVRLWDVKGGVERMSARGHTAGVNAVAFSPDGRQIASAGDDKTIQLWTLEGKRERVLRGHTGSVLHVSYSGDGRELASSADDGSVRIWSAASGTTIHELVGHHQPVTFAAFAPDGNHVVSTGYDDAVRLWNKRGGDDEVLATHPGRATMVPFHPGGGVIGVARIDGEAHVHDLATGACTELEGHHGAVNAIAFDATGRYAATAGDDGSVRTWDVLSGKPHWRGVALLSDPARRLTHAGWSPRASGRWASAVAERARYATQRPGAPLCLLSHDDQVELWDVAADRQLGSWDLAGSAKQDGVRQLLSLPTACAARTARGVALLSEAGRLDLATKAAPRAIGWGEQRLLVATADQIALFSESGEPLGTHDFAGEQVVALSQIADQLVIAYAAGSATRHRADAAGALSLIGPLARASSSDAVSMHAGPGDTLFVGHADGTLAMYDADGALLDRRKLHGAVTHLVVGDRALHALSDLGDFLAWDLAALSADRCALLRQMWKQVPVVWAGGAAVARQPPDDHPCRP